MGVNYRMFIFFVIFVAIFLYTAANFVYFAFVHHLTATNYNNMNITNYIKWLLRGSHRYVLKSDIPSEQIAIFSDNLFFNYQKEVAETAEVVRQILKEEGKQFFVIACSSTFFMEDMRHILESGLGKIAGHAFVYREHVTYRDGGFKNDFDCEGATVVFEII